MSNYSFRRIERISTIDRDRVSSTKFTRNDEIHGEIIY